MLLWLLLLQELSGAPQPGYSGIPDPIPQSLRKSIAVYEAGKALIAYITPEYDEIARVSICPYNMITGKSGRRNDATSECST
jgi:hypothetical protein